MIKHAFAAIPLAALSLSALSLSALSLSALSLSACMPPHIADAQREWTRVHDEIDRRNLYGYRPQSAYAGAQGASPGFLYSNPALLPQAVPAAPYAPTPRTSTTCEFLGQTLYCDHR